MPKQKVDYIIVGMGLAGSTLAIQLLKAGRSVAAIDEPSKNISTRIAAGLFNPITGSKMVKTWLADDIFPYLFDFYRDAESLTGKSFFFPMPLYRPFNSVEEQNEWMGESEADSFQPIIEKIFSAPAYDHVYNPYGGLLLRRCGYVKTTSFIEAVRSLVERKGIFFNDGFDHSRLQINQHNVEYGDLSASRIIFCEGHRVSINPWFSQVGVKGLKGETLQIKCGWDKQVIVNRGVYMVPANQDFEFKVGSTYNWKDNTTAITLEARAEIENKLKALVNIPFSITGQEWGIRPTTADRRPILGEHPKSSRLLIFNGLGTKGVSLAPYFSKVLARWMEEAGPLNKEVNVTRYKLLY